MVIPTLAIALAACAMDAPTTPRTRPPADQAQSLAVNGQTLDALRGTVSDAHMRVLPALGDVQAQGRLASALSSVDTALAAEDAVVLAESLSAARTVLAAEIQARGADSPVAADLDALTLTLDAVEHALPADMRSP